MLRIFESSQSEAAELRQRVNELEEEKLETVRKGGEAYKTRETELLARIDELVQETERLSYQLVSKDEEDSKDKFVRENARLVAEMDDRQTAWNHELSTISKRRDEDITMLYRYYSKDIASLKDQLLAAEQSIEDHATTKTLRAENAEFQRRLQDLKEQITALESKQAAPPPKKKKPAKNALASDNLRKLYVADLNSEFSKKLEEQDRIAKSQAANMEQNIAQLKKHITELERSPSTTEKKYSQAAYQALELENALDEVDRLNAVVAEQKETIQKQDHEYRGPQFRRMVSGDYQTSLPNTYIESAEALVQNPAAPSSILDDSFGEEATSAASEEQLELPAEVTNAFESQYLNEEQMPGNDAISQGKLDLPKETDAGLQEEVEALRRQNQHLQEKNDSLNIQEKKWRRTFEDFTHRAADVQRKDASKRQIKKGLKHLRKIVKEGDVEGV